MQDMRIRVCGWLHSLTPAWLERSIHFNAGYRRPGLACTAYVRASIFPLINTYSQAMNANFTGCY